MGRQRPVCGGASDGGAAGNAPARESERRKGGEISGGILEGLERASRLGGPGVEFRGSLLVAQIEVLLDLIFF